MNTLDMPLTKMDTLSLLQIFMLFFFVELIARFRLALLSEDHGRRDVVGITSLSFSRRKPW